MERIILRILGKRGRTTVPFSLRKELGLKPGDIVSFTLCDDGVKLRREELCDFENCPAMTDSETEITPDTVLEDYASLSPDERYHVMSTLISDWAKNFNR